MNGKGSGRRPSTISKREVDENWERTFGQDRGRLTDIIPQENDTQPHEATDGNATPLPA